MKKRRVQADELKKMKQTWLEMSDMKTRENLLIGCISSKTWVLYEFVEEEIDHFRVVFACKSREELELRLIVMGLKLGKMCHKGMIEDNYDVQEV